MDPFLDPVLIKLALSATSTAVDHIRNRDLTKFENELTSLIAETVDGRQPTSTILDSGADIVLSSTEGSDLGLRVKALRYSALQKSIKSRLQELLATSVTIRRTLNSDAVLVGVIGIIGPPYVKWDSAFQSSPHTDVLLSMILRAESTLLARPDGAGFDALIVGLVGIDGEWLLLDGSHERNTFRTFPFPWLANRMAGASSAQADGWIGLERHPAGSPTRMLLVADEWRSSNGGISTINRELAIALAGLGVDVTVVVPQASSEDRDAAAGNNVNLVSPVSVPGLSPRELLCTRPVVEEEGYCPDVVIGHGRILGPYAVALCSQFYKQAKRVHIVHMDAEQLEAAKETRGGPSRMELADQRRRLETELAISADLVAGVGPLLARSIGHSMRGHNRPVPHVIELVPGLRDWGGTVDDRDLPQMNQVLVLARAEDPVSKGLDIAARAVVHAATDLGDTLKVKPSLVVRGVPRGEAANEAKAYLDSTMKPAYACILRPFSDDEANIRMDMWQSSVVLMPSLHEGFGLAALEAMAAGVPVLITAESGLAELLERLLDETSPQEILTTRGDPSDVAREWGSALAGTLSDPGTAFRRAKVVRDRLAARLSWRDAADVLLKSVD